MRQPAAHAAGKDQQPANADAAVRQFGPGVALIGRNFFYPSQPEFDLLRNLRPYLVDDVAVGNAELLNVPPPQHAAGTAMDDLANDAGLLLNLIEQAQRLQQRGLVRLDFFGAEKRREFGVRIDHGDR